MRISALPFAGRCCRAFALGVILLAAVSPKVLLAQEGAETTSAPASQAAASEGEAGAQAASSGLMVVDWTYEDPDRGFTMQVPSDWTVQKDFAGYNAFLEPTVKAQPTDENPVVADPNISVIVRRDPMPIDQESLESYAKVIESSFTETNGEGSELDIFQKNLFDLPDGKKALLYYMTYKKNGFDVSSAILVMSNDKAMYRVKLTDYKVSFDKNLERLFPVMASVQVPGEAMTRVPFWQPFLPFAAVAGALVVLVGAAMAMRRRQQKKLLSGAHRTSSKRSKSGSGKSGRARSSRPPESLADDAAHSSYDVSEAPQSAMASGSSYGSMAPQSVAQSQYGSVAPQSAAKPQRGGAAPSSDSFPVSEFDSHTSSAAAPLSQPLSVAFGAEPKSGQEFSAHSEAPRSNKPLPARPKAKEDKKAPVSSAFPMSGFGEDDK